MPVVLLLLWYFALTHGQGVGRVVGPFLLRETCQTTRALFLSPTGVGVTPCWTD